MPGTLVHPGALRSQSAWCHWRLGLLPGLLLGLLLVVVAPTALAVKLAWSQGVISPLFPVDSYVGGGVPNQQDTKIKRPLARDAAGNVLVTGGTIGENASGADYLTVKYDGTTGVELWRAVSDGAKHGHDQATSLAVDGSGNVVVTGNSDNGGSYGGILTIKYNGATGAELWRAATDSSDYAPALAIDGSGNVVVTGTRFNGSDYDCLTIKYDGITGVELWRAVGDGAAHGNDYAQDLAIGGTGDVVVTGYSDNASGNTDYLTIKYSGATGAEVWRAVGDGAGHVDDLAFALAIDGSGNVIVTGQSGKFSPNTDFLTIKYNGVTGAELWRAVGDGSAHRNDLAHALAIDASGNVVVTGETDNFGQDAYLTIKYNGTTGVELWRAVSAGGSYTNGFNKLAMDVGGNVFMTGYTYSGGAYTNFLTIKYNGLTGAELWRMVSDGAAHGFDAAVTVALDGSGNVIVAGNSTNGSGRSDYMTIKYSAATGAELWRAVSATSVHAGSSLGEGRAVARDTAGNVVVTGSGWGANGYYSDFLTIKYNAAIGAELWRATSDGTSHGYDSAVAVAIDGSGNVIVTGQSQESASFNRVCLTIKYNGVTGAELWRAVSADPANGNDTAAALAVDGSGNVIVTGYSNGDYLTIKYSGATGAELWRMVSDGAAHSFDYTTALVIDGFGNGLVTGFSTNVVGGTDYLTIKYNGTTGAELWRAVGDGAGQYLNFAQVLAVDASGNVVVTGWSEDRSQQIDYLTIKYNGATGVELWRAVTDGAAHGADVALASAVDDSGNVVVTGYSANANGYADFLTVKYNGTTGAELWRAVTDGAAHGAAAYALAVDGSGNVVATGKSYNGSNWDILTVKLDGATGAELWRYTYAGTGSRDDTSSGVLIASNAVFVAGHSKEANLPPSIRLLKLVEPTVPDAPTGVSAAAGAAKATVSFAPPVNDGGSPITSYTVTSIPGGKTATGPGSPIVVTGLTNGLTYTFTVTATNSVGTGPPSAPSAAVTPSNLPGKPTITGTTANNANKQVTVYFSAPQSTGDSPIILYTATASPGGQWAQLFQSTPGVGGSIPVGGLDYGISYTFTVTATNLNFLTSAPSVRSSPVILSAPCANCAGRPGSTVNADSGNGLVRVSFNPSPSTATTASSAPAASSPITGYTVLAIPIGVPEGVVPSNGVDINAGSLLTTHIITGLTNGVTYVFTVIATNAFGSSDPGPPSNSVTPDVGLPPLLIGTASRKLHAAATFDLPLLPTPLDPTTEPRAAGAGGTHEIVFTFDKPVTGANATVTAGTAIAGVPVFSGSEIRVPLTGVANAQYVTVGLNSVAATDGGTGGTGSIRIGFLVGDVNQSGVVTLSDVLSVNAVLTQPVSAANFLRDVDLSGTLTLSDKLVVNANLTQALPPP